MKLVVAIISNDDSMAITSALTREQFYVTKLSTTGGFLLTGSTTLLIGTEDADVGRVEEIIDEFSKSRRAKPTTAGSLGKGLQDNGVAPEVPVGGATVFVLSVDRMSKF